MNQKLSLISFLLLTAAMVWRYWQGPSTEPSGRPSAGVALASVEAAVAEELPPCCREAAEAEKAAESKAGPDAVALDPDGPLPQNVLWEKVEAPAPMAAFRQWAKHYVAAPSADMVAEGVRLAADRRAAMVDLIEQNPEKALENGVPESVRRAMPSEVVSLLEEKVDGVGDLIATAFNYPDQRVPAGKRLVERSVEMEDGRSFAGFVYGNREYQPSRDVIPIHGVAIDGKMALSQWPGRMLEPVELAEARQAVAEEPVCPVSEAPIAATGTATGVVVGKKFEFFCGPRHAQGSLQQGAAGEAVRPPGLGYSATLEAASSGEGTTVPAFALQGNASWTTGTKRLMMARIKFSDGKDYTDLSVSDCTAIVSGIRTTFEDWSYGRYMVSGVGAGGSIVSPVLTMKKRADQYTVIGDVWKEVQADLKSRGLGSGFDILVVLAGDAPFPDDDEDDGVVKWGGVAHIGLGQTILRTNGTGWNTADRIESGIGTGIHEIGHNLGLYHASNLWNPSAKDMSAPEIGAEYGDRYDRMGTGGRDYNVRFKSWLRWLDPESVPMANTVGTFTLKEHDLNQGSGLRGLQILSSKFSILKTYHLFAEYRLRGVEPATDNLRYVDYNDTLAAYGAQIRVGDVFHPKTWLLDATPETTNTEPEGPVSKDIDVSGNVDSPLLPGRTFSYTRDGITTYVTNLAADPATGELEIELQYGPVYGNKPPSGLITSTTMFSLMAEDQTVLFTADAEDPDDTDFAYHWRIPGMDASEVRPAVFPNERTIAVRFPSMGHWIMYCTVSDKHGGTTTIKRDVIVGSNEAPSISVVNNRAFDEDTSHAVHFTVDDPTADPALLVVTADSTNPELFPDGSFVLSGTGANRMLVITPAPNRHGNARVTLSVFDGGLTSVEQFDVTVRPVTPGVILSAAGSDGWRYWAETAAPPAGWFAPGFSDGAWAMDRARFVNPAPVLNLLDWTVIPGRPTRYTTYYRRTFNVPAILDGAPMIRLLCDDGAVVYLNGTEVHRHNMPQGPIDHGTKATTAVEGVLEGRWITLPVSAASLVLGGVNTIAVEVHDAGAIRGSGDVDFDLEFSTRPAPLVSSLPDRVSPENEVAGSYSFTATDAESPQGPLSVTGFSSDQSIVLNNRIHFTHDATTGIRTVSCVPQPDANGVTIITVRVSDGVAATWRSFALTISPVNSAPEMLPLADKTTTVNEAVSDMIITVGDRDFDPALLDVTASSRGVLSFRSIQVLPGPTPDTRRLRIVPTPGMAATSTVNVSVSDGTHTVTQTFNLRVTAPMATTSAEVGLIRSRTDPWRVLERDLPEKDGLPLDFTAVDFDDSAWTLLTTPCSFGERDAVANLSPTAYRMTTYFRRSFNVPDPAVVGGLQMRLQRDDGAVVYLNGRMVWSSNMPERFDAQTPAGAAIEGSDEADWHFMELPSGLLLPGKNVVAVELHQSDKPTPEEPGDLRFDLELSGVAAPPPPQDVLIAAGDAWAYWDGDSSTDVGEAWTKTNFVDSPWKQGLARHGYGVAGAATGLNAGSSGDPTVANPSALFRKWFDIADPGAYGVLHVFLQVDDGAAVFFNGNRVFEHNVAKGARADSPALSEIPLSDQDQWRHFVIDSSRLIPGRNLIAVSVHQYSPLVARSDLQFDLQLTADLKTEPNLFLRPVGENMELSWSGAFNGWKLMTSTDLERWTAADADPVLQDGWLYVVRPSVTREFFRLQPAADDRAGP
ncbi:MAG: hypothetical protein DVB22_000307 [Verrucomicrobia bacterium]|nr:MAG: hypothetical protein DVB22_000307 [Verrucomicrobiota bacterium]